MQPKGYFSSKRKGIKSQLTNNIVGGGGGWEEETTPSKGFQFSTIVKSKVGGDGGGVGFVPSKQEGPDKGNKYSNKFDNAQSSISSSTLKVPEPLSSVVINPPSATKFNPEAIKTTTTTTANKANVEWNTKKVDNTRKGNTIIAAYEDDSSVRNAKVKTILQQQQQQKQQYIFYESIPVGDMGVNERFSYFLNEVVKKLLLDDIAVGSIPLSTSNGTGTGTDNSRSNNSGSNNSGSNTFNNTVNSNNFGRGYNNNKELLSEFLNESQKVIYEWDSSFGSGSHQKPFRGGGCWEDVEGTNELQAFLQSKMIQLQMISKKLSQEEQSTTNLLMATTTPTTTATVTTTTTTTGGGVGSNNDYDGGHLSFSRVNSPLNNDKHPTATAMEKNINLGTMSSSSHIENMMDSFTLFVSDLLVLKSKCDVMLDRVKANVLLPTKGATTTTNSVNIDGGFETAGANTTTAAVVGMSSDRNRPNKEELASGRNIAINKQQQQQQQQFVLSTSRKRKEIPHEDEDDDAIAIVNNKSNDEDIDCQTRELLNTLIK